jgi:SNF2 family DNA or RNA helicase
MELRIEYVDQGPNGRLIASSDFSRAAWNRLREAVLGHQADADLGSSVIAVDWATVLSLAPAIAGLRKSFGFTVTYDDRAKEFLRKYREERKAIEGQKTGLSLQAEEIDQRLAAAGFTKRILTLEQRRDLLGMVRIGNGANFSVPGAGKTTVALAAHLLTRDEDTFLLIVAPKNAFPAWDEVVDDCMDDSVAQEWYPARLTGGYQAIREQLRNPPRRMLISYDQLTRVQDLIGRFLGTSKVHVILDESHRMKAGDRSQRGASLLRIAHLPFRKDIMSGTPIPRSIEDIRSQLDFLWPGQGLGARVASAQKPHDILQGLYVRTTKHELGLPEIKRRFIQVQMSSSQIALYSIIRQEVLKRLSGIKASTNVDLASAKKSVMRLLQAASNPLLVVKRVTHETPETYRYDDPKIGAIFTSVVEEGDSPKIRQACDLARELAADGQRSVIWTSFTENVERLAEALSDLGATYIHGGIDSGDSNDPNTREGRVRRFHDEASGCRVLVANPAACSEGISLHHACHNAIYVDRSFNAAHYLQSVDRIHRLGLPEGTETNIHILESVTPRITGSVDFSVRRRLIEKLRTMSSALDDYDLQRLALDEEEGEEPMDYDITLDDLRDVIDELSGDAPEPGEEEVL